MTDLNVALILRLVDRLSSPARQGASALRAVRTEEQQVAAAAMGASRAIDQEAVAMSAATVATRAAAAAGGAAAAANRTFSASATMAVRATTSLSQSAMTVSTTFGQLTRAATSGATAQDALARSTEAVGRSADGAARRFSALERMQMRGRAATRMLGSDLEHLDRQLGRLAMVSLATEGVSVPAHQLSHLVHEAVRDASGFAAGMTGFGITAEMSDAQMAPIRDAILQASRRYGARPEDALETYAFTRRSGVFRTADQIVAAGDAAARFQRLASRMGSPVTGEEVAGGASSAVREYGFAADPAALQRFFAMLDAAEKTGGGMTLSDLLQYARSSGGAMKALGAGNPSALADVLAGQQLSMYLAHTGGQAGINLQDLLTQIALPHTLRRFERHGVNLEQVIKGAEARGISPLETVASVTQMMTGGDRFRIGELFANQQASQAMLALIQNMDKFRAYSRQIRSEGAIQQYVQDVDRANGGAASSFGRVAVSVEQLRIAIGAQLLPVASRLADIVDRLTGAATRLINQGGPLGRFSALGLAAMAGLTMGVVALGHAFIGVAGTVLSLRFLLGRALPLSMVQLRGVGAGLAAEGLGALSAAARTLGTSVMTLAMRAFPALTASLWGFDIAVLADPLSWPLVAIVGVVAAVAGAFTLAALTIRRYWQPITAFFGGLGRGIVDGLRPLAPAFRGVGAAIMRAFAPLRPIGAWIGGVFSAIGAWFGRLLTPVRLTASQLHSAADAGHAVGAAISGVVTWIVLLIGRLGQAISQSRLFWEALRGGSPVLAGAAVVSAAVAAHAQPPQAPGRPGASATSGTAAGPPAPGPARPAARSSRGPLSITQNFYLPASAAKADPKQVARELHQLANRGLDAALHDGSDGL